MYTIRFSSLLLFAFLLVVSGCQRSTGAISKREDNTASFSIDYEKYTLPNGLDVILHKDDSDPIVSIAILFNVGSNREKPGRTGFAHFFEHMLFQSSENVGKGNFFKIINDAGGEFNGGTWNDGTIYYEVVPKDALQRVLWMESDRMGYMINTVTDAVLENEKEVVKNEKRQRVDNQPYGHTSYVIDKAMYPADHPYNWQVIGSLQDLQAATLGDVKEFYEKWYGANNATMVIAGDIDFEQTKKWIDYYFSEIPSRPEVSPIKPMPGQLSSTVSLMHEDNFAQLPELRMVWPTVDANHDDTYALQFLGSLLTEGKRAPLYQVVVEEKSLAPSIGAFNSSMEIAGKFSIVCRAKGDKDLDEVLVAVQEGMQRFEEKGIDDRDMERIKNSLETGFYEGLSSILSKSFQLAQANEFKGSPEALQQEISSIMAVTKEDVVRVYNKYVKGKPYVMTSFVPKGKVSLAVTGAAKAEVVEEPIVQGAESAPKEEGNEDYPRTPSRIDRSTMPPLGPAPVAAAPAIWKEALTNGMTVYGIENSELPIVNFSIRLKGGMLLDEPAKLGTANLLADLMLEGTATKTPEELEDAIGQLGASVSVSAAQEFISIDVSCLARNFKPTVALLEEVLLEPRWDAAEFDRIKQSTAARIQQLNARPEFVASRVYTRLIYGDKHPLANSSTGTEATVAAVTIDDLKAYYGRAFAPNAASFHIVGDVSKEETLAALNSLQTRWQSRKTAAQLVPLVQPATQPALYFIDIPDAKQSVVRIGKISLPGSDPNFYAMALVNERLGSGSSGRLFQRLREERGYTYGAYSSFNRRPNQGFFLASASVRANVTREAVELFREILTDYADTFTAEDLEITRTSAIKSRARQYETLGKKISLLENISTLNLPMDYIQREIDATNQLTLEGAKSLIRQHINPGQMIYVVAGDAKTQYPRLRDLGFSTVVLMDREGNILE